MNKTRRRGPWPLIAWLAPLALAAGALLTATHAVKAGEADNEIQRVDVSTLPGNRLQFRIELAGPPSEPESFTIHDPARLALDFPGTRNRTGQREIDVDTGIARSVSLAEADDRTRLVFNLNEIPSYDTEIDGNTVLLTLGDGDEPVVAEAEDPAEPAEEPEHELEAEEPAEPAEEAERAEEPEFEDVTETDEADPEAVAELEAAAEEEEPFVGDEEAAPDPAQRRLEGVDFRRGTDGEARVILDLSDPDIPVSIERDGDDILVEMSDTTVPEELQERLDVLDFATPAQFVDIMQRGADGLVTITPRDGDYERVAYQSDERLTIELQPLTPEEVAEREEEEPEYEGERLSLNFQDIEVRSVLQLLADFTDLNIVVTDSVTGNVTLRLRNVPWDQALDIILQTKGLDKRRTDNVIYVAPFVVIAERERREREAEEEMAERAPLRTEYIQVNYARAGDLAALIEGADADMLSERGSINVDERTNTMVIQDTASHLEEARRMIDRLDIPVRQVLIESRIVIADDDFNRELGARFGVSRDTTGGGQRDGISASGDLGAAQDLRAGEEPGDGRFNVNLPAGSPSGTLGVARARLPMGTLLELELSAMQAEGRGEVVSSPRVITANQREATIEQGVEIPFQEAAASGATSVSFQEAVMSLNVTPQITPDDRIIMDLRVTKDSRGEETPEGPAIDTNRVETEVLVDDGETVVLGGIYEQETAEQVERVPFFGDLPVVGRLFRNELIRDEQSELLVFVTPQIVRGIDDM